MCLLRKLRSLLRKNQPDAEMAEEMRPPIKLQTEPDLKSGMNPAEARSAASRAD